MEICIFSKYKVKYKNEYSYLDVERDFIEDKVESEHTLDGYELINWIQKFLSDRDTIVFATENNYIYIEQFDPLHGTGAKIEIKFERIEEINE